MVLRYIRQMSQAKREKIRLKLAIAYAVIAWNGFGICLYFLAKRNKEDTGLPPGLHEAAMSSNTERSQVLRFDGLSLVETINYGKEEIEAAREQVQTQRKAAEKTEDF